jgi:hypothetical protein
VRLPSASFLLSLLSEFSLNRDSYFLATSPITFEERNTSGFRS